MSRVPEQIQMMRERQLTRTLTAAAILGTLYLAASLTRTFYGGWQPAMYLHIGTYVVFLSCAVLGRYLSFHIRAFSVLAVGLFLGVAGLLTWGLASLGITTLFAVLIFSTILYGTRVGVVSTIVSIGVVGLIGAGAWTGVVTYGFDLGAYLTSPASWLTAVVGMGIAGALIVIALGTLNQQVSALASTLEDRNRELVETNRRLRIEIAERMRAEEDRRGAEVRLKRAEKMEALGTLAAGVAHDLNNMLAGVVGYPDLMLMELPEGSPWRKPVSRMKKTGEKAAAIVDDLLTLARRGVAVTEVVSLNHVVSEYLKSPECEKLLSYHPGVHLEMRLGEDIRNIVGSPVRLSKAVMNLISNAAEAMPQGGTVLISTENLRVSDWTAAYDEIEPGEYVVLTVTDSGTGISPQDLEKIFEPFYTKKAMGRSGTGLGMSVVWGTVKDHGGSINVHSTEGVGTEFALYFPAAAAGLRQAAEPSALRVTDYMGRGEAVLVVDDVDEQREVAHELISRLGYSVSLASSGGAAVDYLRENSADVVLLDMIMDPGIDGLDAFKKIVEIRPGQKVILVSGFSETERVKEALDLGAGCFVRKPYTLERIGVALRSALGHAGPGVAESI